MTTWTFTPHMEETLSGIDAAASATPLQVADAAGNSLLGQYPIMDLFLGQHGGVQNETSRPS